MYTIFATAYDMELLPSQPLPIWIDGNINYSTVTTSWATWQEILTACHLATFTVGAGETPVGVFGDTVRDLVQGVDAAWSVAVNPSQPDQLGWLTNSSFRYAHPLDPNRVLAAYEPSGTLHVARITFSR